MGLPSGERLELARRLLQVLPDRPGLTVLAGEVLAGAGDEAGARAAFDHAARRYESLGLLAEAAELRER